MLAEKPESEQTVCAERKEHQDDISGFGSGRRASVKRV